MFLQQKTTNGVDEMFSSQGNVIPLINGDFAENTIIKQVYNAEVQ